MRYLVSLKQTLKKLVLTITLLVGSVSVSHAEWTAVSRTADGDIYYVDFERIRKSRGYVYFWTLSDRSKPTAYGDLSMLIYGEADCNQFRYRNLQIAYYTGPMSTGTRSSFDSSPSKDWTYPHPQSVYEILLNIVCSK